MMKPRLIPTCLLAFIGCTTVIGLQNVPDPQQGGGGEAAVGGSGAGGTTCPDGFADCDGEDENGCETDLDDDDENCGACWRSCHGTPCNGALCGTINIAQSQPGSSYVAVDDDAVYWTNLNDDTDGLVDVARKGADGFFGLAVDQNYAAGIVLYDEHVYWTNYGYASPGQVMRTLKEPLGANPETLEADLARPTGIAVDASGVYWANQGDGTVWKRSHEPGDASAVILAQGQAGPKGVAIDATWVYWANEDDGTIWRATKIGDPDPIVFASDQNVPRFIVVDSDGTIYWTNRGTVDLDPPDGAIVSATSDGVVTTVVPAQLDPFAIAVDDSSVYWTGNGAVYRAPKGGGARTVLATRQTNPLGIAVDATWVYWAVNTGINNSGSVWKVAK